MARYYELLGVSKSAGTAEIRKAYALLAREKHPDRFPDPAAKAAAQQAFQEITAAFNTLTNEKARREYDESLEKPRPTSPEEIAREAFERGQQMYQAKSTHDAVELFRVAVLHMPGEGRYHAALGRALGKNPNWVREAIQALEKAAELQPRQAAYHGEIAELLAGQGLRIRARKAAEAALRIDPQEPHALRALQAVGEDEPPPPADGGLKGLLRRKP